VEIKSTHVPRISAVLRCSSVKISRSRSSATKANAEHCKKKRKRAHVQKSDNELVIYLHATPRALPSTEVSFPLIILPTTYRQSRLSY
jgi:23S rRNA pseudoU1915 N3-methylase RlmH